SYKKLAQTAAAPPPPAPPTEVLPHIKSLPQQQQQFPTFTEYPSPPQVPEASRPAGVAFSTDDAHRSSGIIRDEPLPQQHLNETAIFNKGERFGRRIAGEVPEKSTLPPPYITYYNQQCSGEILGSSHGETVASASEKCARLNCQAANARATGDGKYDIVFLRTVHVRSNKRGIYCVSSIKIPLKNSNSRSVAARPNKTSASSTTDHPAFSSFKVA
ncbi:hypothetical protein PFISCL1PPCAC_17616, partial [Pristionchus fissidentatus]